MRVTLCGAAGEVTGSGYLVETASAKVLVDFGMFQGRAPENGPTNDERNAALGPVVPGQLDAVVLTHAHLDHCGRLPLLPSRGLRCRIHATPATCDLAQLIMADSAHIQESDAERENRKNREAGRDAPQIVPLYTRRDAEAVTPAMLPLAYGEPRVIAPGIKFRFFEAGHILGSASVEMEVQENGVTKKVVFSGDIGPRHVPILRDPASPPRADLVFIESTYGDRDHRPLEQTVEELRNIIESAAWNKSRVIIPAFAVGRTQLILYYLAKIFQTQRIPDVPIYLDSPMGSNATAIYRKHADLMDAEMQELRTSESFLREMREVRILESSQESMALNDSWDPAIIIASSGMCDGGRVMHHLKHNLWRKGVAVVLIGYMGEGTLGRQLIDGREQVRVLGRTIDVRATIHTLGGFSAHAGQTELLGWLGPAVARRDGEPKPIVAITHGEPRSRAALRDKINARYGIESRLPTRGESIEF